MFSSVIAEGFDPKRLRFVDRTPASSGLNNWLFRGNQPSNSSGVFAYDQIKQTMAQAAETQANATLPDDFYFIDISFENPIEHSDEKIEIDFFSSNSNLGEFINW